MGRKTSTTLQRFGIPFLGYNRRLIQPFLPFELRSSRLDSYGWDRPAPPISLDNKQQYRLSFQIDLLLTQILTQYLQAFQLVLLRLRFKQHSRHLALHIFYLPSASKFRSKIKDTSSSLTLTVPTHGTLYMQLLTESLVDFLELENIPLVLIWHPVNLKSIPYTEITKHLRIFQNLFSKKNKPLYLQGIQLLAILPTYNCNYALTLWTARALECINRPTLLFNMIKSARDFWSQQKQPCYLKGFQLKVKGRLGGVDIATRYTLSWGTLSRQTLSLGVTDSFAPAYTLQGHYGVRIYTHYF